MALHRLLPLLLALAPLTALAQYEYDYDGYGYDFYDSQDDFGDEFGAGGDFTDGLGGDAAGGGSMGGAEDDLYYDEYGYYGDEDEQYYEYYGYYADDAGGYEDYYSEEYEFFEECFFDAGGKPVLSNNTARCDIKITGVNKQADKLVGGLDGVYKLTSCYNGKAMYKRNDSPAGEDRVLWYSSTFGDWDISKGGDPNEAEILMYGGENEHASVPLFVSSWHLGGDLKSTSTLGEDDYLPIDVKVACADGKVYAEAEFNTQSAKVGPVLTDAEMEAKYRYIYDKYAKSADPSPTINFTFVVLLVMTGLTIVLAIPYFLLRKKGKGGAPLTGGASSFTQLLQSSRKKNSGHSN
mmetsp:Transcript_961/g.1504  ORF Transcript_961/g.1504 Transcript_961/m.1504 type:complete len:351 (+) Transcript_961:103-1155(+)|eukprot:CAMPEP_0119106686 /NCGR_PEP_ID=MMETSP1180-20130426/6039_1 /TAXON_ID=3052 ORGANISM="Chlamydomonas cf sp, Strain CCMP681" /NCGR_SAMPLE_ID=MMETSP1180 /ASSEMBLY_ACC=CAM_ASM_000741 /LENGTH=350 /DNA_ID=CAMNT_0007092063 /DNA_START=103 /DNA_END=1155 /DNA_ORIENTATION=+